MAQYNPTMVSTSTHVSDQVIKSETSIPDMTSVYTEGLSSDSFITLQQNLQNCLNIVDTEVMKNYVSSLSSCEVIPVVPEVIDTLEQIQFFRINELVYEENEFSIYKLATVFNALSNKPCTLVLMIQSDGEENHFYLGVRSRDSQYSTGTMRQLLEQSLIGLFPGSVTDDYWNETLHTDLKNLDIGCVSSVTCIADYKQDKESVDNKEFIQGLEKFIYSMQGKAFTTICIANNLAHHDLIETRKEYEQIYTMMSPFANMQYNYALNNSSSTSASDTEGSSETETRGVSRGVSTNQSEAEAHTKGTNLSKTQTDTTGTSKSVSDGKTHTVGTSDGVSDSTTKTTTLGASLSVGFNASTTTGGSLGMNIGAKIIGIGASIFKSFTQGISVTPSISGSVSRGITHGTSHTDSVSDAVSHTLTEGINSSQSIGQTVGENESTSKTRTLGSGTQYSENENSSISTNVAHTKALTDTFGSSQAVTLNVQNKALIDMLQRLDKQLERLDECESIGMWDFAAYFLGESAAEAETAAGMYRSLVSGTQSGLELAAVNTWTEQNKVKEISNYVINFLHPVFLYQFAEKTSIRPVIVDATALASTNELAIQLGLPRKSVKGLPVIEHAAFAQEVLNPYVPANGNKIELGNVMHLNRLTDTPVNLDLESLSMHTFVTGSTGSGKSNTVYQILSQLLRKNVHFLVVEPAKGEYKNVFGNREDVSVYGTNPLLTNLLRINPFSFPKEVHIYEHLDRLVEIFNVCWPMYAAMPAVLKDAIERSYVKAGWDLRKSKNKYSDQLFPNFIDVLQQIDEVMELSQYSGESKSNYKGALCTRIRSLTTGINSLIFTADELSSSELFDKNVIVDLSRVGSSETKSLIMGLLVMKLQEYRMSACNGMNVPLQHVTVLEEAHNLLKKTSTEQSSESANVLGKSVEMLTNAIAEMRTYGEGFIIADQAPGLLDMAVIRNTNTKIIMRLPEYSDRELVGRAAGLTDEQIVELSKLNKGVAAVYQNDWLEAVLCKVKKYGYDEPDLYCYQPEERDDIDVKGKIISRLISKDITHLIDRFDDEIARSKMPVSAKCKLCEYVAMPESKRFDAAASVAYEMFSADVVFRNMKNMNLEPVQQKNYLIEQLTPSLISLPEEYSNIILCLIVYRNAQITDNPETRLLWNYLASEKVQ